MHRFPFPDRPRLWGTAVSHYQVEGGDACDWSAWGREACGAAVDSWSRYESDADLARDAGANAFRFSVSWSRVEPREGQFDLAALERYRRLVEHLGGIGLEPVVTLFHYTHPLWFHEKTPWTSARSADRFARFASRVVEAFGDRVRFYVPLNEPLVFLLAGYLDAQIPPAIADPRAMARAFDNMMAAHAAVAARATRCARGSSRTTSAR